MLRNKRVHGYCWIIVIFR